MPDRRRCRSSARSSSFITTKSSSISSTPVTDPAAWWIASASSSMPGQAATGRATSICTRRRRVPHGSHEAELAQRQADLGIPDRAQRGLDL